MKNINFSSGDVVYNDFHLVDNVPLEEQLESLKEDLLQVKFGSRILLDVGWFPSFNPEGKFQVRIIENYNWDSPMLYVETARLSVLEFMVSSAAKLCKTIMDTTDTETRS